MEKPGMNSHWKELLRLRTLINEFIFLSIIFLIGCTSGHRRQNEQNEVRTEKVVPEIEKDSSYLFNGTTLDGWEITNFGPQGPVYVSGDEIILGMGDGCTGITWEKDFPTVNYKLTLDAMRVEGNDFFCGITFPVGKDPCSLIIGGWGGATVGLSTVNGMDASENETTRLMNFEKNRWYNICLVVKEDQIKAWIDSVLVVDFRKGSKRLSIRPEVELSKPFGIASWNTRAALKNIRVRKNGE